MTALLLRQLAGLCSSIWIVARTCPEVGQQAFAKLNILGGIPTHWIFWMEYYYETLPRSCPFIGMVKSIFISSVIGLTTWYHTLFNLHSAIIFCRNNRCLTTVGPSTSCCCIVDFLSSLPCICIKLGHYTNNPLRYPSCVSKFLACVASVGSNSQGFNLFSPEAEDAMTWPRWAHPKRSAGTKLSMQSWLVVLGI
jgi:hypothetical protein